MYLFRVGKLRFIPFIPIHGGLSDLTVVHVYKTDERESPREA